MKESYVQDSIRESITVKENILKSKKALRQLHDLAKLMENCILNGNKIILAGNGGSAADCQHIAAEFTSRFEFNRAPLAAVALTTDTSALTAIGNDYGYENVFSRQLEALGRKKDLLITFSTSGNSKNIINLLKTSKKKKIFSICLLGNKGGQSKNLCDYPVIISSMSTARIQEMHQIIYHNVCSLID